MTILILAPDDDEHANAVQWGLAKIGQDVGRISGFDFPKNRTMSLRFNSRSNSASTRVLNQKTAINLSRFDCVWRRRGEGTAIDKGNIHPNDHEFAKAEAEAMSLGWREMGGLSSAIWINPVNASRRANNKIYQLTQAQFSGFKLPETFFSNDPGEIRQFVKEQNGRTIYKPLSPAGWEENDKTLTTYANIVTDEMLADPEVLQLTPGIYQGYVQKLYELRVNVFGDHIVATKINNQGNKKTEIDWRKHLKETTLETYKLPQNLEDKIRDFMKRTGLLFGAIDIIKSVNGDYVFLEINQMGQFLWIDIMLPQSQLLATAVSFFANWGVVDPQEVQAWDEVTMKSFRKLTSKGR